MSTILKALGFENVTPIISKNFQRVESFFSRTYQKDMEDLSLLMKGIEWVAVNFFGCEKTT
jgi:hypothetical protein